MPSLLQARLLGPLSVTTRVGTDVAFTPIVGRLFASLALSRGSTVTNEGLARLVWGLEQPPSVKNALQQHVGTLRKVLADESKQIVVSEPGGYRLEQSEVSLDLDSFEEHLGRASTARSRQREISELERALLIWRGSALEDLHAAGYNHSAIPELNSRRAATGRRLAEALLVTDQVERAVEVLERDSGFGDYDEEHAVLYATALSRSGRQVEALQFLSTLIERLLEDQGLGVGPEIRQLEQSILNQAPHVLPRRPATSGGPPSRPLPRSSGPLIGRTDEVAELSMLTEEYNLVSIVGIGGLGKTRVALEVATAKAATGTVAYFADLAPRTEQRTVVEEVCASVGLTEVSGDPLEALSLRLSEGTPLFVLDNCEHVLGSIRDLVDSLRTMCPNVAFLLTSRESVGLEGEFRFDLSPLDALSSGPELLQARANEAGLAGALEQHSASELCQALDGIPLAIELAAPWLRIIDPSELLGRLIADPFAVDRHPRSTSSLERIVEWSISRLDDEVSDLLLNLSFFPGGFSLAQADMIFGGDTVAHLAALSDASLLLVVDSNDGRRYRILEPIRAYATALATERGRADLARLRQAEVMREVATEIAENLPTPAERHWRTILEIELPNLAAATAWTAAHHPQISVDIATPFAPIVSFIPPGVARLAVPVVERGSWRSCDGGVTAAALAAFAIVYIEADPQGMSLIGAVVQEANVSEATLEPSVFVYLGTLATIQGDPQAAIDFYDRAIARGREIDDVLSVAEASVLKSGWCWFGGRSESEAPIAEASTLAERLGGPSLISLCEVISGFFAVDRDRDRAEQHFRRALSVDAPTGYGPGVAEFMLGLVHALRGDRDAALSASRDSIVRFSNAGLQFEIGMAFGVLARVFHELGEPDLASWVAEVVQTHFAPIAALPGFGQPLEEVRSALPTTRMVPSARRDAIEAILEAVS